MKRAVVFTVLLVVLGAMMASVATACICTADYTPVCGQNNQTYSNECRLGCSGVKLAYRGECGSATDS